jgi:5-methyltetrahydrofolate--homocysteine methyltransferase
VRVPEKGTPAIIFENGAEGGSLPIPEKFTSSMEWTSGKVKHTAVAVWQGLYGDGEAAEAAKSYVKYMVDRQEAKGACFLDVNVDEFSTDPEECGKAMRWLAGVVRDCASTPLSIDSSNPGTLETGLSIASREHGKPMVNSVSLEREDSIRLAKDAGAVVIASAGGKDSMPSSKEERISNLDALMKILEKTGFAEEDIYMDPLVFPVSVDPSNGTAVLDAIKVLRETYGDEIHFAPGLSNISFGMPNRKLINQVFTYLCAREGLDGGIVDPLQINGEILSAIDESSESFRLAQDFLLGKDMYGKNYITAIRSGTI